MNNKTKQTIIRHLKGLVAALEKDVHVSRGVKVEGNTEIATNISKQLREKRKYKIA